MTAQAPSIAPGDKPRLMSLDVFRGLTIASMILVNNPGTGKSFYQLEHSAWNGWTFTDLVFPFFLFIAGVSLVLSFGSRLRTNESKPNLLLHVARRAAIIFVLGLLINAFPYYHLATWRIPGVLQRIAICYFIGSALYLWANARVRWIVAALLLVGYWALMRLVPVPGAGVPGVDVPLLDPNQNIVAWLDRKLMWGHLYEGVRDPEGVLSTLPAIVNVLFGVRVGEWLREHRDRPLRLVQTLLASGSVCFVLGEVWNIWFPINKKLWTSSYVLVTVGLAMMVFGLCYWLLDVAKVRGAWTTPLRVFGTNAIFAYAFSEFVAIAAVVFKFRDGAKLTTAKEWLLTRTFSNIEPPKLESLAYALFFVAFCWFFTWLLYRRKIFLKV